MPTNETRGQRGTIERVMHEFKEGELKTGGGKGPKVKNRKQAIAIALSESGATNQESPKKNKQNLARTKTKESRGQTAEAEKEGKGAQNRTIAKGASRGGGRRRSDGEPSKAELMAEARQRNIAGRSKMSKSELQRAISH
ncbi:MAG TPA: DUF6496 domain-containing protein [Devosiaceae bacterium]|nr:DUF6496 domain-containing protein [Devosiaceae bacterium]